LTTGVVFGDDQLVHKKENQNSHKTQERAARNLAKLIKVLNRICILIPSLNSQRSSQIASACVFLARQLLGYSQVWREELVHLTGLFDSELRDTVNEIIDHLKEIPTAGDQTYNTEHLFPLLKKVPLKTKLSSPDQTF